MVRFIISRRYYIHFTSSKIYIPIWLDLLLIEFVFIDVNDDDLHSNMVRFIINVSTD